MYQIFLCASTQGMGSKLLDIFSKLVSEHNREDIEIIKVNSLTRVKLDKSVKNSLVFIEIHKKDSVESFQTLGEFQKKWANNPVQEVLIVDPNQNYFDVARQFKIGNILFNNNFDLPMIWAITRRLLFEDFFGLKAFFPKGFNEFDQSYTFSGKFNFNDILTKAFQDFIPRLDEVSKYNFTTAISELTVNALSYGVYGITPEDREANQTLSPRFVEVPTEKAIQFHIVEDDEKWGLSVTDQTGSLTLNRVLEKIERHTAFNDRPIPAGIEDLSGRGLFILSRQNRLVINILNTIKTEIIIMRFKDSVLNKYQSFIINEKNP